jgi:hypothetical protein
MPLPGIVVVRASLPSGLSMADQNNSLSQKRKIWCRLWTMGLVCA